MDYETFIDFVKERRSIRFFKPDPIPEGYIEKILEAARWAPSAANSQPWEFIVVKDKKLKDNLIDILVKVGRGRFRRGQGAPVLIIVCGDVRTKIFYPPPLNVENKIFNLSLTNVFLYIHLAARTLGIGSQWVSIGPVGSQLEREHSAIKKLLNIPEYLEIFDMVALGYPAFQPKPRSIRSLDEITHYDLYDKSKSRTENDIRDASRKSWTYIQYENQREA